MKNILIITLFVVMNAGNLFSQSRTGRGNSTLGLKLGASLFDIKTDNFITSAEYGFVGGFTTRGDFYNNWDIQFGLNILNNRIGIQAHEIGSATTEMVDYSLLNVQGQLLFGFKVLGDNRNNRGDFKLTLEFGPVLTVNGKLKLKDESKKGLIVDNTNLTAEQVTDLSGININGLGGFSLGSRRFRAFVHYQYGINNVLSRLNNYEEAKSEFKGHVQLIQFGIFVYL